MEDSQSKKAEIGIKGGLRDLCARGLEIHLPPYPINKLVEEENVLIPFLFASVYWLQS
jgi:hypothetical protein